MSSVSQDILLYGWVMNATGVGFCLKAGFPASGIESFGFPVGVSYFITFYAVSLYTLLVMGAEHKGGGGPEVMSACLHMSVF
jgi:hypothetical protein